MTDWNSLPGELVQLIADKLSAVEDFVALTCVCRSFRSSAEKDQWRPPEVSQPPWLLLSCWDNDGGEKYSSAAVEMRSALLSMYKKKKLFRINLPELHKRLCFGTPYGWIITLGLDLQMHLFNPLNQRHIILPPPSAFKDSPDLTQNFHWKFWVRLRFMHRALLIKRPHFSRSEDFTVVVGAIWGELSVMRPQQNTWETMNVYPASTKSVVISDIAYYNDQIYVVGPLRRIYICSNLDGPGPLTLMECVHGDQLLNGNGQLYLLESLGDLLLVVRHKLLSRTRAFNVFKFNHQTKKLIEVQDLGDRSLFVGECQSISLSPSGTFNCLSNCIYYTHDNCLDFGSEEELDMGVFDLKERIFRPLCEDAGSLAFFSAATWFIPTFS